MKRSQLANMLADREGLWAMAPSTAVFAVLGPLQVSVDGASVPLGGPKQRVILAALLMNRNRPVAVESLIAGAWGEDPPAEARTNIHVYVSNLRKLIGTAGADGRAVLEKLAPGYRLNVDDTDVDVGRFVRENDAGVRAAAARRFEEASRHLSVALAEWRGPVLEDLRQFEFIEAFAVAMTEQKMAAHAARAQAEIACGRAAAVIGELESLVAEHPYREPVWAQLMTAYYLSGRQSDALATYRRLKVTLADDLGIDPNAALRDLHEQILRQQRLDVQESAQATALETMTGSVGLPVEGPDSTLTAWLNEGSAQRYPLERAATSIGRLSGNDIVLTDAKVSRRHATIVNTGISFVIHDTGSANGVELNGRRIVGSATLADGDSLRIGNSEFIFELRADRDERSTEHEGS
jgi:SARP family transcriptional regulator, regulator of embCAB operon